ncbi:hypothetical protein GCM10007940_10370 [Portibacter lacus]|uniref:Exo-alpha-sialidase n=2 Tax=Portibacter lacus TaxID=1099794 RepID=A0AA37WDU9_9BACT|nr:hypothetical protein GCM10007940_10370 [Portibacter lacus]
MFLISCEEHSSTSTELSVNEILSPSKNGGEPNLFVSDQGEVYLSWVEYLSDSTNALLFSKLKNDQWSAPKTIASGGNWFVNWADFPSLVVGGENEKYLAAHWLQKSDEGTYDYDIRIAQSADGGENWSSSFVPHRDSISAEHGFVSMLPQSNGKFFATWLDGRNTKGGGGHEEGGHGHGGHGAMTLRAAVFDQNGNLSEEAELDSRICDCCQTAAVETEEGIIVAYRDRSDEEIRDISVVRKVNGKWTTPKPVFNDLWRIEGCPVNGPSLDAIGKVVGLAWFTMSGEEPQVKVAFSNDNGAHFAEPLRIDGGNPLGRVDMVMISNNKALVSWQEETADGTALNVVQVSPNGIRGEILTINVTANHVRNFPRMVKSRNQIVFAWTEKGEETHVKTAIMNL